MTPDMSPFNKLQQGFNVTVSSLSENVFVLPQDGERLLFNSPFTKAKTALASE